MSLFNYLPITINNKNMANGQRNLSKEPLTENEILFVKQEIYRIGAGKDIDIFVFNDEEHLKNISLGTGYDFIDDKIYITKNVFPETQYGSTHPRDLMSVGAVLAHEYFGHRPYREEYLKDYNYNKTHNDIIFTTPIWEDECRASINAAKLAQNLTDIDKQNLILDAVYRAKEYGQYIQMDDYMKEVLYGKYTDKPIIPRIEPIVFVKQENIDKNIKTEFNNNLSQMQSETEDYDDR